MRPHNYLFLSYGLPAQEGVVLFIALVILVAMTLAGIALVRSVDTASVISGNLSYRLTASQASDQGVENAYAKIQNIIATSATENQIQNVYYPFILGTDDAQGNPFTSTQWNNVPASTVLGSASDPKNAYQARYIVERLCKAPYSQANCLVSSLATGSSKTSESVNPLKGSTAVFYRITAQITGPRNTVSYSQAIMSN